MQGRIVEYICPQCGNKSNRYERKGIKEHCRKCGAELIENKAHSFSESGEWESTEKSDTKRICVQREAAQQELLFEWAELAGGAHPELNLMYHIPNGGSRNGLEAANLKKQGVKAGVPDVHLPVPRGQFHSLYIEMKVHPNKPTEQQLKWIELLNAQGNRAIVCYSWIDAKNEIEKYLSL